ncbi:MAG TPA: hypothetical protein VFT74_15495 [Isosphaeraceae bacterium]|nr:hypothetical protein [Isosphaeraceae bacterium]
MLTDKRDARQVFDRDFLEIRARILELAAALDRLDRAPGRPGINPDRRLAEVRQALETLLVPEPGRAETVQTIFSREYDPDWMRSMKLGREN